MEAQRITLTMEDHSAGYEANPARIKLGTLVKFTSEVAVFLKGESREVEPANLEVAVKEGSLAIQTAPIPIAPTLFRDLIALLHSNSLDALDAKRREVLEGWQKAARSTRRLAYRIDAPFLNRSVVVSAETDFHADDSDQWVLVERYVRGEIQDLGGATKANAHIRLPDGHVLTVNAEQSTLRDDVVNRLYKQAMLRIKAEYNVLTRELRNAKLIEFVEYAPRFDKAELTRLTRRGVEAWKDVPSATAWVDDLRGTTE